MGCEWCGARLSFWSIENVCEKCYSVVLDDDVALAREMVVKGWLSREEFAMVRDRVIVARAKSRASKFRADALALKKKYRIA